MSRMHCTLNRDISVVDVMFGACHSHLSALKQVDVEIRTTNRCVEGSKLFASRSNAS
jgi:hypothetical protein